MVMLFPGYATGGMYEIHGEVVDTCTVYTVEYAGGRPEPITLYKVSLDGGFRNTILLLSNHTYGIGSKVNSMVLGHFFENYTGADCRYSGHEYSELFKEQTRLASVASASARERAVWHIGFFVPYESIKGKFDDDSLDAAVSVTEVERNVGYGALLGVTFIDLADRTPLNAGIDLSYSRSAHNIKFETGFKDEALYSTVALNVNCLFPANQKFQYLFLVRFGISRLELENTNTTFTGGLMDIGGGLSYRFYKGFALISDIGYRFNSSYGKGHNNEYEASFKGSGLVFKVGMNFDVL